MNLPLKGRRFTGIDFQNTAPSELPYDFVAGVDFDAMRDSHRELMTRISQLESKVVQLSLKAEVDHGQTSPAP